LEFLEKSQAESELLLTDTDGRPVQYT